MNPDLPEKKFDAVLAEVVRHELVAIAEEMAIAISKTGRSAMVKMGDFAVALCDAGGRVMGPGYGAPMQMVVFAEIMRSVWNKWKGNIEQGDIVLVNDPHAGAGHLPDVAVIAPVFWEGRLAAFAIAYSHHTDIGGRFSGGLSSQASSMYEEGVCIPNVKLYQKGVLNEALLETLLINVRAPDDWRGDLLAKIAGCARGERELHALLARYGLGSLQACGRYLEQYSEHVARAAIREIPDGDYEAEEYFGDDGFGNQVRLPLKVKLTVDGASMRFDFSGTAPQAQSAINVPLGMTKAMVFGTLYMLIAPGVVINEGYMRPVEIHIPAGTILNPNHPGAVGGRAPLMFAVADLILAVLAKAVPDRVPVSSESGDVLHFSGKRKQGGEFALMDLFSGGWGGRPTLDGIDGASSILLSGYATVSAELLESEYPVVIEGFGLVPDSAGPGKYRGSLAVYRQWRFLQDGHIMLRTIRPGRAVPGINNGGSGHIATTVLNPGAHQKILPAQSHLHLDVRAGDTVLHTTPGAGGQGHPYEREVARVLDDVREGKLSIGAARDSYGVVINTGMTINEEATAILRGPSPSVSRPEQSQRG